MERRSEAALFGDCRDRDIGMPQQRLGTVQANLPQIPDRGGIEVLAEQVEIR
ncbi:hypothetical protein MRS74_08210 [Marinobacterium sp. OS208]|nr:hypothetical protein [Marinobacterium sedimentorum]MCP8687541.1 hypothetical protein [Marinobacterium sedimentorum]